MLKYIHLSAAEKPCELELASGYAELEKASRPLFAAVEKLQALKSVLNDGQYWSSFPRTKDGVTEELQPTQNKVLAAWFSARLAFERYKAEAKTQAEALIAGPITAYKQYLQSTIFCSSGAIYHRASNIVAAEQLASRVLNDIAKVELDILEFKFTLMAPEALEAVFKGNFERAGSGWKREQTATDKRSHLGPPISDEMVYLPFDLATLIYPEGWEVDLEGAYEAFLQLPEVLAQGKQALKTMRTYKGNLNEETFGLRMQKVLKKPAELEALVSEQHARRCQLGNLLTEVETIAREFEFGLQKKICDLLFAFVHTGLEDKERERRLVAMNNALVITQLFRRFYDFCEAQKKEVGDNPAVYDAATEALRQVILGEEPLPKVIA